MEAQARRQKNVQIQDQENMHVTKKDGKAISTRRQGLTVRGALGEIKNTFANNQAPQDIKDMKATIASETDKISTASRGVVRRVVQSKVDSGLSVKNIVKPTSRPPLRREESTGRLAVRAVVTRAVLKDAQNKPNELKEPSLLVKRSNQETKLKKLSTLKETKEANLLPKQVIKEPTESLCNLKLTDNENKVGNKNKVKNEPTSPKLPSDIEDIDAGDDNTMLLSCYVKDIYKYLTNLEEKYPIKADHLRQQVVVTEKMRATLIDWLVEVQKQFSLLLETFHMTVGIIDRYLQVESNVPRNRLQLVGITAMFIASKYEEVYAPDVEDFIFITDNAYSKSDVIQCEIEILSKLEFCLSWPIPLSFLRRFVKAARGSSKNHHLAKYFVDLCLVEYSTAHYRPSELAAAAVCLSLYILSSSLVSEVWTPTLSYYSGYKLDHIFPIMRQIAKIVINVKSAKNKSVYTKYLEPTLGKVSSLAQLSGAAIRELASIESTPHQ